MRRSPTAHTFARTFAPTRLALAGLLLGACALAATPARAAEAAYQFSGITDSGVFAANDFFGSFAFDAAAWTADYSGTIALSGFTMSFRGQSYTLASADTPPEAVFVLGQLVGVAYVDGDSPDTALRPWVGLAPGFDDLSTAYFAYDTSAGPGGFGSLNVTAVPEPAAALLMLAGLGALGLRRRG